MTILCPGQFSMYCLSTPNPPLLDPPDGSLLPAGSMLSLSVQRAPQGEGCGLVSLSQGSSVVRWTSEFRINPKATFCGFHGCSFPPEVSSEGGFCPAGEGQQRPLHLVVFACPSNGKHKMPRPFSYSFSYGTVCSFFSGLVGVL